MVLLVFALAHRADSSACTDAQRDAFAGRTAGTEAVLLDRCRGGRPLTVGAGSFLRHGDVSGAARLAQAAIDRDPDDVQGWAALSYVLERRDEPEAAARVRSEARRLDPRSFKASSGRSTP